MAQLRKFCQVTNGSQTVTIPGADYSSQIVPGSMFFIENQFVTYFVAGAVFSGGNTNVTLTGAYQGTTSSAAAGVFTKDLLSPSEIPLMSSGDVGKSVIFNEAMAKVQKLYLENTPTGAAAAAIDAANNAAASATTASDAAAAASAAATGAQAAKTAAETAAATVTSEVATISTKVADATTAATNATAAAVAAQTAATNAQTAANDTAALKTTATASKDKAQQWADAAVNVEVETGKFSAKHWAAQAAASITSNIIYKGAWDASTAAYPAAPAVGHYYRVSVAGTVSGIDYAVGDAILYNGTSWDKLDNTENITNYTDVPGLVAQLNLKAAANHTHSFAEITNKPTTIAGYGITDALSSTSPQMVDSAKVSGNLPVLEFVETDQPVTSGRYRAFISAGVLYWRRNTANAGDFSTENTVMSISGDVVTFYQTPKVGANDILHTGNFDPALKVNVADYTPAEILNRLKQVDGVGSGLDGDLFDGLHASQFARPIYDTNFVNLRVQGFQVWHAGNYPIPVRSVNGVVPDVTGNVNIDFDGTVGSGSLFPGAIVEYVPGIDLPEGWIKLQGQVVPIVGNEALYAMLGDAAGTPVAGQFTLPTRTNMAIRSTIGLKTTVPVVQNFNAQYQILQMVQADKPFAYQILTQVGPKNIVSTWDVHGSFIVDLTATYNVG